MTRCIAVVSTTAQAHTTKSGLSKSSPQALVMLAVSQSFVIAKTFRKINGGN